MKIRDLLSARLVDNKIVVTAELPFKIKILGTSCQTSVVFRDRDVCSLAIYPHESFVREILALCLDEGPAGRYFPFMLQVVMKEGSPYLDLDTPWFPEKELVQVIRSGIVFMAGNRREGMMFVTCDKKRNFPDYEGSWRRVSGDDACSYLAGHRNFETLYDKSRYMSAEEQKK